MLASVAFIWNIYTEQIADYTEQIIDYTEIIPEDYNKIPEGYNKLESYPLWDGSPPYDVRPPPPSHSRPPSLKESEFVISGKVLSFSESKWSTPDGQKPEEVVATTTFDENGKFLSVKVKNLKEDEYIYTDMDVRVDTIYKGKEKLNSEIITIRLRSGTVGEFYMSSSGGLDVRNYNEGDEVFLFLNTYGNGTEGLYYLPTSEGTYIKLNITDKNIIDTLEVIYKKPGDFVMPSGFVISPSLSMANINSTSMTSNYIISATVSELKNTNGSKECYLDVNEVLRGNIEVNQILLRTYEKEPELKEGDEYILFIKHVEQNNIDYYYLPLEEYLIKNGSVYEGMHPKVSMTYKELMEHIKN
jgi:hypothetical protein